MSPPTASTNLFEPTRKGPRGGWRQRIQTTSRLGLLGTEGAGNTVVHTPLCPGDASAARGKYLESAPFSKRYSYASLDKNHIPKLRMTYPEE